MISLILLALGSFMISGSIAYAWWSNARITFLRQELFQIRDRLWVKAFSLCGLTDPAYQDARRRFNANIHMAPTWSLPIMETIQLKFPNMPATEIPKSTNPDLQTAIDAALVEMESTIVRHVVFYQASGWLRFLRLMCSTVGSMSFDTAKSWFRLIRRLILSTIPESLSDMDLKNHQAMC